MRFTIERIIFKKSEKYDKIAWIDAKAGTDNDLELSLYTASGVLIKQLEEIDRIYGSGAPGLPLKFNIAVEVISREAEESKQSYLSFI